MEIDKFPNDSLDVKVHTTHKSDLKFTVNDKLILRLGEDGSADYMGRPIKKDFQQIYYGLKNFLIESQRIHKQTLENNQILRDQLHKIQECHKHAILALSLVKHWMEDKDRPVLPVGVRQAVNKALAGDKHET